MIKGIITLVIIVGYIICTHTVKGQSVSEVYKSAVDSRYKKEYKKSDSLFKLVFKMQKKHLPEDICYHYGVVLYTLKNSQKAEQFFVKYLKLSPENKIFRDSTVYYLGLLDTTHNKNTKSPTSIILDTCDLCHGAGTSFSECTKCHAKGNVFCYQCAGSGLVAIKTDIGNQKFMKCNICQGKGSLECGLCKGKKNINQECIKCRGVGKVAKSIK